MNALQIPELSGKNPTDERRCVLGSLPHSSWRKVLAQMLISFPEVQNVSFAKIKPGVVERGAFCGFHVMAFYLSSYMQLSRVRELELLLKRLFQVETPIHFVFARLPGVYGPGIGANLYPMTPLMEKIRSNGTLLHRSNATPMISPLEQKVHQILLERVRAVA